MLRAVLWSSAGDPSKMANRVEGWGVGGAGWGQVLLVEVPPPPAVSEEVTPSSSHVVGGDWLAGDTPTHTHTPHTHTHPPPPRGLPGSTSEQRALPIHFIYFIPVGLWEIYI